jgi:hypothetical protein
MSAKRRKRDYLPKGWELDWYQLPVETLPSILVTIRVEGWELVMECEDLVMEPGLPENDGVDGGNDTSIDKKDAGSQEAVFVTDCQPCPTCQEPICPKCGDHYGDCPHPSWRHRPSGPCPDS